VRSLLYLEKPTQQAALLNEMPLRGDFGLPDARVIVPGDPFRSVLYFRMAKTGSGQMPHLGTSSVHREGLDGVFEWIMAMEPDSDASPSLTSAIMSKVRALADVQEADPMRAQVARIGATLPGVLGLSRGLEHGAPNAVFREAVEMFYQNTEDPLKRDVLARFFEVDAGNNSMVDLEVALTLEADMASGRRLFHQDPALQCATCHRIGEEGREYGPDLSRIGEQYTKAELLEHILEPSKKVDPRYQVVTLETEDGEVRSGMIAEAHPTHLLLRDALGGVHRIQRVSIVDEQRSNLSAMPEGLLKGRSVQEVADLIAYLKSMRQAP